MKSFRDLLEEHIENRYGGSAAAMSRATGFTTTTISAWRRGKVALPHLETRRDLAKELGITHVELLVAMGELSADEVEIPEDPRSEAVRRLAPVIDSYEWDDVKLETAERLIRSIGEMYRGRFPAPSIEE